MTDIGELCEKVYGKIEWQKFPAGMDDDTKMEMIRSAIVEGIEDLFIVTGRAAAYSNYSYTVDEWEGAVSEFSYDLQLDEKMYVICYAQIFILSKVRNQYTELLGYTTNALTVTNADKPYAYLTGVIDELKRRMDLYYYKMVRFSHLS